MKQIFLSLGLFLILAAAASVASAQEAVTPAADSPVRKAITAAVKKKFPKIKVEERFKVNGDWARVIYSQTDNFDYSVNLILKKTGKIWKIVLDVEKMPKFRDPADFLKGVPDDIAHVYPED